MTIYFERKISDEIFLFKQEFCLGNATKRKKLSPKKDIDLKKCFLITDFTGKNFLSLLEQNK